MCGCKWFLFPCENLPFKWYKPKFRVKRHHISVMIRQSVCNHVRIRDYSWKQERSSAKGMGKKDAPARTDWTAHEAVIWGDVWSSIK